MTTKNPLGIRLNNPANIRYNSLNHWYGQVGQSKGFCKFRDVKCGVRALIILLRNYRYCFGLKTVRQIISRYAPANENDTEAYIQFIVDYLNDNHYNVSADSELNLDFFASWSTLLCFLCAGICKIETNYNLTLDTYRSSLHLCSFC